MGNTPGAKRGAGSEITNGFLSFFFFFWGWSFSFFVFFYAVFCMLVFYIFIVDFLFSTYKYECLYVIFGLSFIILYNNAYIYECECQDSKFCKPNCFGNLYKDHRLTGSIVSKLLLIEGFNLLTRIPIIEQSCLNVFNLH